MNFETPIVNCCLRYGIKQTQDEGKYEIHTFVIPEEVVRFKNTYNKVTSIPVNPKYNAQELFLNYAFNNVNDLPFDYYELTYDKLNKAYTGLISFHNSTKLRLSCDAKDISQVNWFLKQLEDIIKGNKDDKDYAYLYVYLLDYIRNKQQGIANMITQQKPEEIQEDAEFISTYLRGRIRFLEDLYFCLNREYNDMREYELELALEKENGTINETKLEDMIEELSDEELKEMENKKKAKNEL